MATAHWGKWPATSGQAQAPGHVQQLQKPATPGQAQAAGHMHHLRTQPPVRPSHASSAKGKPAMWQDLRKVMLYAARAHRCAGCVCWCEWDISVGLVSGGP
eukprot:650177-Pelagomonas_calceolata.AAC.5